MTNQMDTTKKDSEDKTGINTLPEYKIRTMKDDLAKAGPAKGEPAPPEKLPIAPSFAKAPEGKPVRMPLPSAEELISEKPAEKAKPIQAGPPKSESFGGKSRIPILEKKRPKKLNLKPLIIPAIIVLIIIIIGGFFYWQGTKPEPEPEELPTEVETPTEVGAEPSASLIPVDEIKILSLSAETSLLNLLKQEVKTSQLINTFERIVVLKNEQEFLSLKELFQELEIPIPPYTLLELKQNYTLVLYNQTQGRRLGFIIEIKNSENLRTQLFAWEQTMVSDFKNFYPSQSPGQKETETFQDDIYPPAGEAGQETTIRYINLPNPYLTLNYAIKNNFLIIGTSKDIIYTIIDKIKM